MMITKIQYTVKPEFVETNKQNIQAVMEELKSLGNNNIRYSSYIFEDGKTFMHFVVAKDEETNKILTGLEVFKKFQTELKASGPEVPPKVDHLNLVGSSFEILS